MELKLDRPLVFFDLETTGVDVARDRVVQVALIRLLPDGSRESFDSLVNPGMPIPPEASAVHHITDEMVRSAPSFRDLTERLAGLFDGADVGGFGVTRFDVPMICAEFARAGRPFDVTRRRVVDALTIFHRLEPRNLAAAYEFYCGKSLAGAHDARADVNASYEVFLAQLQRYREPRPPRPGLACDVQAIHDFCSAADPSHVDARGRFVWRHGHATFNFGKHQSRTLEEVVRSDRSYVEWLMRADMTTPEIAEICRKALLGEFPRKQQAAPQQRPEAALPGDNARSAATPAPAKNGG